MTLHGWRVGTQTHRTTCPAAPGPHTVCRASRGNQGARGPPRGQPARPFPALLLLGHPATSRSPQTTVARDPGWVRRQLRETGPGGRMPRPLVLAAGHRSGRGLIPALAASPPPCSAPDDDRADLGGGPVPSSSAAGCGSAQGGPSGGVRASGGLYRAQDRSPGPCTASGPHVGGLATG